MIMLAGGTIQPENLGLNNVTKVAALNVLDTVIESGHDATACLSEIDICALCGISTVVVGSYFEDDKDTPIGHCIVCGDIMAAAGGEQDAVAAAGGETTQMKRRKMNTTKRRIEQKHPRRLAGTRLLAALRHPSEITAIRSCINNVQLDPDNITSVDIMSRHEAVEFSMDVPKSVLLGMEEPCIKLDDLANEVR